MVSEEREIELSSKLLTYARTLENVSEKEMSRDELSNNEEKLLVLSRGERIFLVIEDATKPLRIEVRCDYKLGKTLQTRYESVMQSRALGRNGIEIVCSGQLSDDELIDLVRHGYEMSTEE